MKKRLCVILLSLFSMLLAACSSAKEGQEITIYYINSDENALVQEEYQLSAETKEEQIMELMAVLMDAEHNVNYYSAIPEGVIAEQFRVKDRQVDLIFSEAYLEIPKAREVLLRAAVVQTLVQLPEVSYVSFYVGENPLTSLSGKVIGLIVFDYMWKMASRMISATVGCGNTSFLRRVGVSSVSIIIVAVIMISEA